MLVMMSAIQADKKVQFTLLALLVCFWIRVGYAQTTTTAQVESTTTLMSPQPGNFTTNATSLCSAVDTDYICYRTPDVRFLYQYPQNIPGLSLSARSVEIGFIFLKTVNPPLSIECEVALQHIMCLGSTPPCSPESKLLLAVCPNSCNAYNRLLIEGNCSSVTDYARQLQSQSNLEDFQIFLELLLNFDCSDSSTYIFYDDEYIDQNRCTDIFRPGETEQILSQPNQCVGSPSPLCDLTIGSTGYYLPLEGRGNDTYIDILHNLFETTDDTCKNVLLNLVCYYEYPPCDPSTGNAIPVCSGSCDAFSSLVGSCLSAIGPDSPLVETIRGINCSDQFSYLYPFIIIDNTTCINSSDFDHFQIPVPPESGIAVGVIAGATVGAGIFIILVLVVVLSLIILVYHNKRKGSHNMELLGYRIDIRKDATNQMTINGRFYSPGPGTTHELTQSLKDVGTSDSEFTLSETERTSYEKVFSSILVPFASLTVGEEIGQGAFGKVYLGEMLKLGANTTKEEIAIKTIKHLSSHEEVEAFFAESFVMKDFKHPNVLSLSGICFDTPDGIPYILLPYMANGSLKDYLKRKRVHVTNVDTFPEDLEMSILVKMCLEIAQGMQYLSGMKFVHRDLAARNCMVDTNLTIKVGDFGLARDIYSADYYRANKNTKVPVKWMPPETLHDGISNEKTDIWSYGVTCWEVFSLGRTPYPGIQNQDILKHIACGERLDRPTLCPKMLYDVIMYKSWELRPEDRPSFDDLVHQLLEYWEEEHAYVIERSLNGL